MKTMMMFQGMHGQGWGMGWILGWNWIIGLVMLVLIIWLIVKLTNLGSASNQPHKNKALDILSERYARGEIDKQEYEERKTVLKSS